MTDPVIPRCGHGNVILGCPEEPCDEQTVYLIEQETMLARWRERQQQERQQQEAHAIIRGFWGVR